MTAAPANRVNVCTGPKGGQGCTTISAVLSVLAAQRTQPTLLLRPAGHRVIVDTGTVHGVLHRFGPLSPRRLLVTRQCYLALRFAIGVLFVPDHVVLIAENRRALTQRGVSPPSPCQ